MLMLLIKICLNLLTFLRECIFLSYAKVFDVKKLNALFKENLPKEKVSKTLKQMTFYKGAGCRRCGQTGYKGRVGIYEVLLMDDNLITKINQRATADDIKKYGREHGMTTIMEDGLIKAKMGTTTISEILRVTKE